MEITEQLYKRNQKRARWFKILAPIVRWSMLVLGVLFLILAIKNSIGNILEIKRLLNSKTLTGEELKANYDMLIDKYGEWHIGNGGAGFSIEFIDITNAIFSGVAITCFSLSIICFASSYVFGKWLLPILAKQIDENNQNAVNLTVIKMAEKDK